MIRFIFSFFTFVLLISCSLNEDSKIWNNKEKDILKKENTKKILSDEKKFVRELNPSIKLNLTNIKKSNKINHKTNNFGSLNYLGYLKKKSYYKFSKFNDIDNINSRPIFLDNSIVFFDNKGTIIHYNNKNKFIWKKNYYSKSEKKQNPALNFASNNKYLIIVDDVAKLYSLDIETGNLLWSKKNKYPFNSQIKIHGDKFFAIDYSNTLKCFKLIDGSECWSFLTEDSFTLSNTKYSLVISNDLVIFSNSIGDITAVNISDGSMVWQTPTQSSKNIKENYNFSMSKLVIDEKDIYFSNNKNQFYSIQTETGNINWVNEINSNLMPIIIGDFIFSVSNDGYLFVLQKKLGNIIKINDIYKNYKIKKRKNIKPVGLIIGGNKIYLNNSDGTMHIIDLQLSKVVKIEKISGNLISKPYIYNGKLYVVKNGAIIKYD